MLINRELPGRRARYRKLFKRRDTFTTANFMDKLADLYGDKTIAILDEQTPYGFLQKDALSYNDALHVMNRMANSLRELGVRRGSRVVVYMRNRLELALACYALFKIGAVAIPLNHLLRGNEVSFIVRDCDARLVITHGPVFETGVKDPERIPEVKQWLFHETPKDTPDFGLSWLALMERASPHLEPEDVGPDDLAGIFYTSGTTGFPKGAQLTSKNLISSNVRIGIALATFIPVNVRDDTGLTVQPLAHIMGFGMFMGRIASGVPFVVMERFHPERVMEAIERHKVTMFIGVPAMYAMMLNAGAGQKYDLSSVKVWVSGSDKLDPAHRDAFKKLGRLKIGKRELDSMFIEGYGQAETSPTSTIKPDLKITRGAGCIGWPLPGVDVRIVDKNGNDAPKGEVGELWVRGSHVMKGYWKDRKSTEAAMKDGWLKSGDLVKKGKYGLLYLVDREKDVIKVGGYSVFSREVEQEMLEHHDIHEAAVIPVPHETKGQLPIAVVALEKGADTNPEELASWAKENIAPYKVPRHFEIVDELPRNSTMKVDKKLLKNRYKDLKVG